MRKKWKRSKNRILVTMLAFLCLFSQFSTDVNAEFLVGNFIPSISHTFAPLYGSLAGTESYSLNYESFSTFPLSLTEGKIYHIWIQLPYYITYDSLYDDSKNLNYSYSAYLKYGGVKYYSSGSYISAIVSGVGTSAHSIGVDLNVSFPFYDAPDEYIYANEYQFKVDTNLQQSIGQVYELAQSDLEYYQQFQLILQSIGSLKDDNSLILDKLHSIMLASDSIKDKVSLLYDLLVQVYGQDAADKIVMDNFQQNSSSQSSQLGQLNQENQLQKIDINNASTTVDSNIDLNAVGSSGVVLSSLTGHQKILTMLLGVTAISLIAYVFFGKR